MMQIEMRYRIGDGPYRVGGEIDNIPFELCYDDGEAYIVILTDNLVLRTDAKYNKGLGKLDTNLTGQLIFNLAKKIEEELPDY